MAELRFEPTAAANLSALFEDPTKAELADRIETQLDLLEANPADPQLTRTDFRSRFGLIYAVRILGSGEEWLMLWKPHDDTVHVYYLGDAGSL